MKAHNRKFLEDVDDSPSSASSMSSRYHFGYPRPLLPPTTNSNSNGDNDTLASISSIPSRPTISAFDSSAALTVLVLLAILFFMGFFSVYIHWLSDVRSPDDPRRRRDQSRRDSSSDLDPSIIKSLPLFAYDGDDKAKEPVDCPICLSEFEEKETVTMIPFCGHVFHPQCIATWLSAHGSCPLCRSTQLVPPPPGDPGGGSGHPSIIGRSTDIQSSGSTGIEIDCGEDRELSIPSCLDASVKRANSFSSSSSSRFGEDRDRNYSLSLPRSSSF